MTYTISLQYPFKRPVERGSRPKKQTEWKGSAWVINRRREKTTHDFTFKGTHAEAVEALGQLINGLFDETGCDIHAAGWQAMARGGGK